MTSSPAETESLPFKARRIIGQSSGPTLTITGGVHGDEYEPILAVQRLIGEVQPKRLTGTLMLVPCVNESAFRRRSRVAEDELDLARTCPGSPSGSGTERVAHSLSQLIRSSDFYVDLHTGGALFRATPLAGYFLHEDPRVMEDQRRLAHAFNLPLVWGTPYQLGRSLSVAYESRVPAIYCEHGGGGMNARGVSAYVDGCLNVMRELKMIEGSSPPSLVRHVVEDPRSGSGHLQVQYPSPVSGIFQSFVEPGDVVEKGQQIGEVSDLLGEQICPIEAHETGVVVIIRAVAQVNAGETLCALASPPPGGA